MIVDIANIKKDKKIIIMTWTKRHVELLYKKFSEEYPDESVDTFYGTKKRYKNSRILIATIDKLNRGFDEKSFCPDFDGTRLNCLFLVSTTRSKVLVEQMVGRVLRSDDPSVYYFIDDNNISKVHYRECRPVFKGLNAKIKTIDKGDKINQKLKNSNGAKKEKIENKVIAMSMMKSINF